MSRTVSLVKWLAAAALILSTGPALAAWTVRYEYEDGDDRGVAVANDAAGHVYALVAAQGDDDGAVVVVCYGSDGSELRSWTYDNEADNVPSCFAVTGNDPANDVIIYVAVVDDAETWKVIAFDESDDEPIWQSAFAVEQIEGDLADIALQWDATASDWGVVASGNAEPTTDKGVDWLTISYHPNGSQRWHSFLDGYELDDLAKAVACNGSGDVFVTGQTTTPGASEGDEDAVIRTVQYSAGGQEAWVADHNQVVSGDDEEDEGLDVVAYFSNYVYVAAKYYIESGTPPSTYGTVILRYDQGVPGRPEKVEVEHDYYSYVPVELAYYYDGQGAGGVFAAVSKWAEPAETYIERHFTTIRLANSESGLVNRWQEDFPVWSTNPGDEHAPCGVAATNNVCCYVTGNIADGGGNIATLMYSPDGLRKELWQAYGDGLDQAADVTAYLLTTGART